MKRQWSRTTIFSCGDCLFLILVGGAANLAMRLVHGLGLHMAFALLVGMVGAMMIQTLMAAAVAPILGSIESMVSSMVVAMISPMVVCSLDLGGISLSGRGALALGVAGGFVFFLLIEAYGRQCRKTLCCGFQQKRG